jgi:hypothetical protein
MQSSRFCLTGLRVSAAREVSSVPEKACFPLLLALPVRCSIVYFAARKGLAGVLQTGAHIVCVRPRGGHGTSQHTPIPYTESRWRAQEHLTVHRDKLANAVNVPNDGEGPLLCLVRSWARIV